VIKLVEREVSGAVVVEVHGKLIGGTDNCDAFHNVFKSLLNKGKDKIIIDLSNTPWANSQGIGMLIGAHTSVSNAGGKLVLAHVPDRIKDVLVVAKLGLIFKSFDNEEGALWFLTGANRPQKENNTRELPRTGA
jgi:anti-anti-sigma factor